MWTDFVDVIRATIFGAAHVCNGSLGAGILLVSFLVRIAFLPVMLRLARTARAQQLKLAELKPQLERIQKRYASDPAELWRRTQAFYRKHNVRLFDGRGLLIAAAQMPLLGGLFSAVRTGLGAGTPFLWIGNLARPDAGVVLLVAALTTVAGLLAPKVPGQANIATFAAIAGGAMILIFLWTTSSAVALSIGAGSAVSAVQNVILRRERKQD